MDLGDRLKKLGSDLAGIAKDAAQEVQKKGGELADAAIAKGTELKDAAVTKSTELAAEAAAKGTELKTAVVAKGTELAQQGQDIANKGLAAGEELAKQGVASVTATSERLTLKARFGMAVDKLATGNAQAVDADLVKLHQDAMTDPTYATKFALYASGLTGPQTADKTDVVGKVSNAVNNGVNAISARSELANLAIK